VLSASADAAGAHTSRRSGFARFTSARYSSRKEDIGNTFIHLTNVAIQKHAPGFDKGRGMKWPIRNFRAFMATKHGGRRQGRRTAGCSALAPGWRAGALTRQPGRTMR
jgi:hypothetical protein